jgi:hypothetical protein
MAFRANLPHLPRRKRRSARAPLGCTLSPSPSLEGCPIERTRDAMPPASRDQETAMKRNLEDDYFRPRDLVDTIGAYVVLLVVVAVALMPLDRPDAGSATSADAGKGAVVVAQRNDRAPQAAPGAAAKP